MTFDDFRGHQKTNFLELREQVGSGLDPVLVAACGYGKGFLISRIVFSAMEMARQNGEEVSIIFAVHGISLVADMSSRIAKLGIPHGILVGGKKRERWHPVQVASIDTLARMQHPPKADIFIIDEAHLSLSPIWRKTLDKFPDARRIGCTATPIRLDNKGLGKESGGLFDSMILGPSVLELISQGYLVRSRVFEPPPVEGAKEIKLSLSDNLGAQSAVFNKVKLIGDEIRAYREHALGRKGITFGTDQKHAFAIAEQFTLAGIPCAYVDAATPLGDDKFPVPGTRAHIYRDLDAENGNLMLVSSVGCQSVGFDHPIISYLGIMRRTGSFGLWHQMMGRGSRIRNGKEDFVIIDHAGNAELHYPLGYFESEIEWSLDGEAVKNKDKKKAPTVLTCKQSVMNCWCGRTENHTGAGDHLACYGTFKRNTEACPHCGCPIIRAGRKIETVDGVMSERQRPGIGPMEPVRLRSIGTPTSRHRVLDALLNKAAKEGKQQQWAAHEFKAKFGMEPPRSWMPAEQEYVADAS